MLNSRRLSFFRLFFGLCYFQKKASGSIKCPKRPLYALSYNRKCHLTHKIATHGSISLPLFTCNPLAKTDILEVSWKDKFAASKFWNHKIAEKIFLFLTKIASESVQMYKFHRKVNLAKPPPFFSHPSEWIF